MPKLLRKVVKLTFHSGAFAIRTFRACINYLYNRLLFSLFDVEFNRFPQINGRIDLRSYGNFKISDNVTINSNPEIVPIGGSEYTTIRVASGASLFIGCGAGLTNSVIFCSHKITIEEGVFIGRSCRIYDTDFHSLIWEERISECKNNVNGKRKAVVLHKGCFIGTSSIILKGVEIGERSIIGAGSVVTKSVPSRQIWGGNPAKFLRFLDEN